MKNRLDIALFCFTLFSGFQCVPPPECQSNTYRWKTSQQTLGKTGLRGPRALVLLPTLGAACRPQPGRGEGGHPADAPRTGPQSAAGPATTACSAPRLDVRRPLVRARSCRSLCVLSTRGLVQLGVQGTPRVRSEKSAFLP